LWTRASRTLITAMDETRNVDAAYRKMKGAKRRGDRVATAHVRRPRAKRPTARC
jgi:hypothetical protein